MTSVNPENTVENSLPQEKVDAQVSQEKVDATVQQPDAAKKEEKAEDPNWKAFREARKKDRAEKEAAERRAAEKEAEAAALKAAMEAAFSKSTPVPPQYPPYQNVYPEQEETEEQRIERKVQEFLAKKEENDRRQAALREQQEYPTRLVQNFADFNNVVTTENLDYLEYHHPELARTLKRLPDGYDKWSDAYQVIKKYVPNATTAKKESAKAEANFMKPRSMSNTGLTQNTEAPTSARLSEERKAANWARMQQTMKGISA